MSNVSETPSGTEHPFAPYIRILGKGKSGSRALTQMEARDAFGMILRSEVEPLQLGAFLMLLRVKEETPAELAGFVEACRKNMLAPPPTLHADLDWSSYAGKKHQHPWFILSMLLLAQAGHRVFVHGSKGHTAGRLYTEDAMRQLGLPIASNWSDVDRQLKSQGLSYFPLELFCPALQQLMQLRPLLGLRSPVNTLIRMMNPLGAPASLQSIFHRAYGLLHQETDRILKQPRALVFKGDSGEVEVRPQADTLLYQLQGMQLQEWLLPRSLSQRVTSVDSPNIAPVRTLWREGGSEPYGLNATLATTAAALLVLLPGLELDSAQQQAALLWRDRDRSRLP